MLADAQTIFKSDVQKNRFVYKTLYKAAKSQSPASIRGYVTDKDGKGLAGAVVTIQNTELPAVITNKHGYFSYNRLAGDKSYMMEISKPDYGTKV